MLCAFVSQFQLLLSNLTKGNFSMLRPGSYSFNVVNKLSRFVLQSINIATLGAKFDSKHFYLFIQLLVGFYETNVFSGQISLTIDQVLKLFTLLDWARIWIDRRPIDGLRINWNSWLIILRGANRLIFTWHECLMVDSRILIMKTILGHLFVMRFEIFVRGDPQIIIWVRDNRLGSARLKELWNAANIRRITLIGLRCQLILPGRRALLSYWLCWDTRGLVSWTVLTGVLAEPVDLVVLILLSFPCLLPLRLLPSWVHNFALQPDFRTLLKFLTVGRSHII